MGKYDLPDSLVWVDIETLGLNPERRILELAICITDRNLDEIYQGQRWTFQARPQDLAEAEPVALKMHTDSGLLSECLGPNIPDDGENWSSIAEWVRKFGPRPRSSPMCGSSVHFDRMFLRHHARAFHDYFSYRNLDVSSLLMAKELLFDHREKPPYDPDKKYTPSPHRALDDLRVTLRLARVALNAFGHPKLNMEA